MAAFGAGIERQMGPRADLGRDKVRLNMIKMSSSNRRNYLVAVEGAPTPVH